MLEIYWLQRLGNIGFVFNVGFWVCVFVAIVTALLVVIQCYMDDFKVSSIDKRYIDWLKKFVMVFGFFTVGAIITPTQNDLMAIYGLGGTIDYIKRNDKAKELPDKVVDALTRYVDHIEKDSSNQ